MSEFTEMAKLLGRRGGRKGGKSKSKKKLAAVLKNLALARRVRKQCLTKPV